MRQRSMQVVRSEVVAELLGKKHGYYNDCEQGDTFSNRPSLLRILAWRPEPSYSSPRHRLASIEVDVDGDLEVPRRRKRLRRQDRNHEGDEDEESDVLCVLETMNQGDVDATGTQIWRASFLLAEYIQSHESDFRDSVVLELGCGVGFVAIRAARVARVVVATDGDSSALAVCERNVRRNSEDRDCIRVRFLTWQDEQHTSYTTVEDRFKWTSEDDSTMQRGFDWIIASDVFYDDEVADLFLDKLHSLLLQHPNAHAIVAMERRIVFSAVTMGEISLGYDAFCARMCPHDTTSHTKQTANTVYCQACALDTDDLVTRFVATRVPVHLLPRVFQYDRVSTLEIWKLGAVKSSS